MEGEEQQEQCSSAGRAGSSQGRGAAALADQPASSLQELCERQSGRCTSCSCRSHPGPADGQLSDHLLLQTDPVILSRSSASKDLRLADSSRAPSPEVLLM
jgi:hypothetical protein